MVDSSAGDLEEKMLDIPEEVWGDGEVRTNGDEGLLALGLLDAVGAIEFLVDIEDVFGVYIAPTEVERDEMNTVNLIIHQVEIRL